MPAQSYTQHPVFRYLLAIVVTGAAIVATKVVQPLVAPSVTPPFILAVAIAALFGGTGPGAVASLLGVASLSYWFFPSPALGTSADLARQVMFLVVAIATTWIVGSVHRQRWLADRQSRENERLRRVAEEEAGKAQEATVEAETAAQDAAEALERQVEAEEALRRSEAELSDFFDNASIALHWVAGDGRIVRVNQAELTMLGYQRSEYIGHHIAEFHADRPAIDDILSRLQAGEVIYNYPARLRCKDGTIKDVLIDSSAYQTGGRFVHSRCFTREVTVEKQAQEAMAHLGAIVSSSSDAIIGKTLDGVVTSWNAAAERIFGYPTSEMVGQPIFRLIPAELHDSERYILSRLRLGKVVEFAEAERLRKDGKRIWISLSVSPVRDRSGVIIGAASIKRDITERKLAQEHLRDAQRLQAVGQLAGGIAHEANNQMSVVLGGALFLLNRSDLAPAARHDVELIRHAAERTASITQQLLAFSRRQVLQLQDTDLNRVVRSIESVLRRALAEHHALVLRLGLPDELVRADQRQVDQVLLNLTLNARDAMPKGGRLIIETCVQTITAGENGTGSGGPPPGRYATVVVQDTGHGMDHATLQRAFEPFFTTKEVGQGTGLGLPVVHGIMSQSGGYVVVESEAGKGTTFTLYFPVISTARVPAPPSRNEAVPSGHGRTVLLVEDDPLVLDMASRGLADAGYTVLEARHGREALDLVRDHAGRLDVVITDLGMPDMDGNELARHLHAERPGLPVILISGYGDAESERPLLRKPFAPDVLVRKVGEVLDTPG